MGRSLSLVSRYIHDTSSPVRYQSVAVRGPHQTIALASLLENTPPDKRSICDLAISIDLRYSSAKEEACTQKIEGEEMADVIRKKAEAQFYESARRLEKQAADAFLRILDLVSPSIQTLSISFRDMAIPVSSSAVSLPGLRELTLAYGDCLAGRDRVSDCALSSLEPLSSLRRLNIQLSDVTCTPLELIGHIAKFAPNITHVRLPVIHGSWEQVLDPNEPHPDGGEKPLLPRTIEVILVQPRLPSGYMSGNGWSSYKRGLDQYRSLAMKDNRVIVLQPATWEGENFSDEGGLGAQWLDRLNGGMGCWKTDRQLLWT